VQANNRVGFCELLLNGLIQGTARLLLFDAGLDHFPSASCTLTNGNSRLARLLFPAGRRRKCQ
jgi:hypothetical protein